jgi:hypothetical protein
MLSNKGSPVKIKTPIKLKGTKKKEKRGNKT